MTPEPIYFECHITIEPVEGERFALFEHICSKWEFKPATLLMQKTKDPSKLDSFCTGKNKQYLPLANRMYWMLEDLGQESFKVYRYKIEAILLDQRYTRGNV